MHTDENGRWIGSMIWLMVALAGMVFGADAFIRSLANYQRNPSGANLIMLIVTEVFLALSIVEVVFTAVKFVQALKSVSSYSSASSLAQGADEVVVTSADDSLKTVYSLENKTSNELGDMGEKYIIEKRGLDKNKIFTEYLGKKIIPDFFDKLNKYLIESKNVAY